MGFRSALCTEDYAITWPEWFRGKYAGTLRCARGGDQGALHSIYEAKTYVQSEWGDLHTDIQRVIDWTRFDRFVLVYLHECGGITRCQIEKDAIKWTEPDGWLATDGVTHDYCYGCSDAPASADREGGE